MPNLKSNPISHSLGLLSQSNRRKIFLVVLVQVFAGFLDLLGVAALGVLGSLAINGIQSKGPGDRVSQVIAFLNLGEISFQAQVAVIGVIAAALLIARTIFAIVFTRKTLFFLSRQSADLSSRLFSKLVAKPLTFHNSRTTQDTLYSVTAGVSTILLGIVGSAVSIVADLSSLIVLSLGLFVLSPIMAIGTFVLFLTVGILVYKLLHKRAGYLGNENTRLNVVSNELILEVLGSFRELFTRNRLGFYATKVARSRFDLANTQAELQFMPNISKYAVESATVIGALLLCAYEFTTSDASRAIGTLAVFMAAGSRIAPSMLRIQQSSIVIRSSVGSTKDTFALIAELEGVNGVEPFSSDFTTDHSDFVPNIDVSSLYFKYPDSDQFALENVSIKIEPGTLIAIVGPSGAGKTTLVDCLLGILTPAKGEIRLSSQTPKEAIKKWPGAIGYVPQDIQIVKGSVQKNISMGFEFIDAMEAEVERSLKIAQIWDFVNALPHGTNSEVGERGSRISGGQRQRLGIARSLFTSPKILILDEATSALDGQVEAGISKAIVSLKGTTTVISIAHRLSTMKNADQVLYLKSGRIIASGTFEEVREMVPDFNQQVSMMGGSSAAD